LQGIKIKQIRYVGHSNHVLIHEILEKFFRQILDSKNKFSCKVNGANPSNAFNIIHIKLSISNLQLLFEFKMDYDNLVANKNCPLILNES